VNVLAGVLAVFFGLILLAAIVSVICFIAVFFSISEVLVYIISFGIGQIIGYIILIFYDKIKKW